MCICVVFICIIHMYIKKLDELRKCERVVCFFIVCIKTKILTLFVVVIVCCNDINTGYVIG